VAMGAPMAPKPIHPTVVICAVFLLLVVWIERRCGTGIIGVRRTGR
jgi:hypothetical protein